MHPYLYHSGKLYVCTVTSPTRTRVDRLELEISCRQREVPRYLRGSMLFGCFPSFCEGIALRQSFRCPTNCRYWFRLHCPKRDAPEPRNGSKPNVLPGDREENILRNPQLTRHGFFRVRQQTISFPTTTQKKRAGPSNIAIIFRAKKRYP